MLVRSGRERPISSEMRPRTWPPMCVLVLCAILHAACRGDTPPPAATTAGPRPGAVAPASVPRGTSEARGRAGRRSAAGRSLLRLSPDTARLSCWSSRSGPGPRPASARLPGGASALPGHAPPGRDAERGARRRSRDTLLGPRRRVPPHPRAPSRAARRRQAGVPRGGRRTRRRGAGAGIEDARPAAHADRRGRTRARRD